MSILTANTLSLSLIPPVVAMVPLGVLTAIAGAIHVGGASWLKRLVGRARENKANVEIELISSVSQEVCELWNCKSIVRSTGQPEVKQIIHLPAGKGDISPKSFITAPGSKDGQSKTCRDSVKRVCRFICRSKCRFKCCRLLWANRLMLGCSVWKV